MSIVSLKLEISPSAEFNRTMLAEEFRQSQYSEGNYTSDFRIDEDEEDEEYSSQSNKTVVYN